MAAAACSGTAGVDGACDGGERQTGSSENLGLGFFRVRGKGAGEERGRQRASGFTYPCAARPRVSLQREKKRGRRSRWSRAASLSSRRGGPGARREQGRRHGDGSGSEATVVHREDGILPKPPGSFLLFCFLFLLIETSSLSYLIGASTHFYKNVQNSYRLHLTSRFSTKIGEVK